MFVSVAVVVLTRLQPAFGIRAGPLGQVLTTDLRELSSRDAFHPLDAVPQLSSAVSEAFVNGEREVGHDLPAGSIFDFRIGTRPTDENPAIYENPFAPAQARFLLGS